MTIKTIKLSAGELESVERVLARLAKGDLEVTAEPQPVNCSKDDLIRAAELMLAVRRSRVRFLHRAMLGEAPYDMLLALYATPEEEQITPTRLAELSGLPQSSSVRWLEYLIGQGLVTRSAHPTDKRASIIKLTSEGRAALDEVARELWERVRSLELQQL